MDITQELIDGLSINEVAIIKKIALELNIRPEQVSAVVGLVNDGCTIPFIARYRKESHGSLDEVQVRACDHLFKSNVNLESRRLEIARGVFERGKLTESLYDSVMNAATLTELEDLWTPFKKKKKTRGMAAIEKGLEPLADIASRLDGGEVLKQAERFVHIDENNEETSVESVQAAIQGAKDIIAERIAQNPENRAALRAFYMRTGSIAVKGVGGETEAKTSVYQMYWNYREPLNQIKAHRILAINRGERENALEVSIEADLDAGIEDIRSRYSIPNEYFSDALEDGVARLLSPSVLREIRGDQTDAADEHGVNVFSENLKNLLMQRPIKGARVLGVDPGLRTGTKCAALDETGKYLGHFVIYQHKRSEAEDLVRGAIKKYGVQLIAVGNGTGSRETQEIISAALESFPDVMYTVVDEDGASVYSASDIAREEFPDLDLTIRGAVSIGRRLQDPLAELVKIDPKSIGVGLYQHDVNQKKLSESLDDAVGSVVNNVGVNLDTASYSLLKYVSGVNSSLAKKIVEYRNEKGRLRNREELKLIPGMGAKTFEQCAGFLKLPNSEEFLDNTWVHPENYPVARELYLLTKQTNLNAAISHEERERLKKEFSVGSQTLDDIIEELKRPNRDPREDYPKPLFQKGAAVFEDLKEGMKIIGKIKNVVDFGAFVDIGIKETGLLHVSEIGGGFVSDPLDVLKVGDIKEFRIIALDPDRRRISLSLKPENASSAKTDSGSNKYGAKKAVRVETQKPVSARNETRKYGSKGDDGLTYNPFADALKNMKKQ